MAEVDMTLSEAERLLGVTADDSRDDIQAAYRTMAKKYHPDAWISAAPAARKKAEETYKKLTTAKRVLMNPSVAKPETSQQSSQSSSGYTPPSRERSSSPYSSPSYSPSYSNATMPDYARTQTYGGHSQVYKAYDDRTETHPRPDFTSRTRTVDDDNTPTPARSGSWAATGTSQSDREKFNRAKSFSDQFGATRDDEEDRYVTKYRHYAEKAYKKNSDVLRWSTSVITTVLALVLSVYTMMNDLIIGNGAIADELGYGTSIMTEFGIRARTFLVLIGILVVKLFLYDLMIAPAMTKAISKKVPFLYGVPFAIGGVMAFLACFVVMGEADAFLYGAVASIIAGIIIGIAYGAFRKMNDDDE